MKNTQEEQVIQSEEFEIDEEEKRLRTEDSRKQLKAILITFVIILTSFLTFTYFFFNYIEEKAEEYKQHQEREAQEANKTE